METIRISKIYHRDFLMKEAYQEQTKVWNSPFGEFQIEWVDPTMGEVVREINNIKTHIEYTGYVPLDNKRKK